MHATALSVLSTYLTLKIVLLPDLVNKQETVSANMAQIVAKLLQITTWLLLTAYRNLPTPYTFVPSLTPYDVQFSRKT